MEPRWMVTALSVVAWVAGALGGGIAWNVQAARLSSAQAGWATERAALANAGAQRAAQLTQQLATEISNGRAAAQAAQADAARLEAQNTTLQRRIASVTQTYRPAPAAALQPLPACIVTTGAVGLLNDAYGATGADAAAADAAGGVDPAATADAETDSGVRLPHLLAWSLDAGTRCRRIESQLNRLIDYLETP